MNIILIIVAGFVTTVIIVAIITSINYRRLKQIHQSLENMVEGAEKQFADEMELVSERELVLTNSGKELSRLLTEIREGKIEAKNRTLYYKETSGRNPNLALVVFSVIVTVLFVAINNISDLSIQKVWVLTLPSFLVFSNWILRFSVHKPSRSSWRPSFVTR